tara:strand:- start:12116 stop:12538 length:423 start_codon:yes stop_codon:yes gene_type:complete
MLNDDISLLTTSKTTPFHGVSFPVVEGVGGFFAKTDGAQTTMSGLKQLLLTSKGERVMNPEFGTSLRKSVFEPFTSDLMASLKSEIRFSINKYHPEVEILALEMSWDSHPKSRGRHKIFIQLKFQIKGELINPQILDIII